MPFNLSQKSLDRLEGVNDDMVRVVKKAIELTKVDFGVICGLRTVEEQEELRIALEPDDGFLQGAPYNPVVVLPTGAANSVCCLYRSRAHTSSPPETGRPRSRSARSAGFMQESRCWKL